MIDENERNGIEDALRGLFSGEGSPNNSDQSHDDIIEKISPFLPAYLEGNKFEVGDWIMPRKDANIKGVGLPCVVVEVPEEPVQNFHAPDCPSDTCASSWGTRLDIRILQISGNHVAAFWVESFNFEKYQRPSKS